MTNGNSAEREAQAAAFHEANSKIFTDFEDFEAGWKAGVSYALSVCADGGKDSSDAEPVEESDVRPRERLCGGSHIACNGVDYCLGHPSCRDIANERAKKEQK